MLFRSKESSEWIELYLLRSHSKIRSVAEQKIMFERKHHYHSSMHKKFCSIQKISRGTTIHYAKAHFSACLVTVLMSIFNEYGFLEIQTIHRFSINSCSQILSIQNSSPSCILIITDTKEVLSGYQSGNLVFKHATFFH